MKRFLAVVAIAVSLGACSSDPGETDSPTGPAVEERTTAPAESPTATAPALTENEQVVATFTGALDALGIEYTEPTRTEAAGLSKASYELTVNGFNAAIQIFPSDDAQAAWVDASDQLGGVCVVIDGAALSLNSSDGIANSVEIAPQIAAEVDGEAHGV